MASAETIIEHHLECFGRGDLEGILSDYAADAILFTPQGPLKGHPPIRKLFQGLIQEFARPGARFELGQRFVVGDYGYILWTAQTADNVYELATDTFHVRDGKIQVQSFAGKVTGRKGG
jgi:ketosteroid isomerase-like protein